MEHDPSVLDTAAFHCQQTAEKALKAFLVWKGVRFEKAHSLTYLLDLCEAKEAGLAPLRERAEILAPFAVEIRYPGEAMEVSREEAQETLAAAEAVWDSILSLLPSEFHPLLSEGGSE